MERSHHTLISDGVMDHERTLHPSRPFWVFLSGNTGIGAWMMGVLVAGMGVDFTGALFVLVFGNIVGSALPGLLGLMGTGSGLSQLEASRFSLGAGGKRLPALLNWVGAIGWDAITNILSASALVALLGWRGVDAPYWLVLAVLVGVQLVVGVYGHHVIQQGAKVAGILVAACFVAIGLTAIHNIVPASVAGMPQDGKALLSAFVLLASFNTVGWATYAADYTRYLPRRTPGRTVFLPVFLSLFLSSSVLGLFGYLTAAVVTDQSPAGIMAMLQRLAGPFGPVVLLLIGLSAIPINAINDNSAAYSLISAGVRWPRPAAAAFGAVLGYAIALVGSKDFMTLFENFLLLFAHWIAPWAAILLVHWFSVGRHALVTAPGIAAGGIVFIGVSVASLVLFSANPLYTGPAASSLNGLDIGPFVGFAAASLLYWTVLRSAHGKPVSNRQV